MAKRTVEHSPLYRRIGFGFTAHPITVWAGVILLRLYFEWIKLREELGEALVGLSQTFEPSNFVGGCDAELVLRVGIRGGAV